MTKDEVADAAWSHLSAADTDKDGAISKAELEAHFKQRAAAHAGSAPGGPRFGGMPFSGRPGPHGPRFGGHFGHRGSETPIFDRLMEHADKNKDGKLTKDEVPEFMWTRLSTADTDKDGAVSKAELEQHVKQLRSAGHSDKQKPADQAADKPADKATEKVEDKKADEKPAEVKKTGDQKTDEPKADEKKADEKKPDEK